MKQKSKESQKQKKKKQNKTKHRKHLVWKASIKRSMPWYTRAHTYFGSKTSHQHPIEQRRTRRSAGETSTACTYPNVCNICKKGRIQHNENKVSPVVITLFQAQETIKATAKVKDEQMYSEIEYLDLIS